MDKFIIKSPSVPLFQMGISLYLFQSAKRLPNCTPPRFIPTCVGNVHYRPFSRVWHTVHPHVCGERYYGFVSYGFFYGSSPRVWGTFRHCRPSRYNQRFIPTCVGNVSGRSPNNNCISVHPHVCGERLVGIFQTVRLFGSSPRVWGTFLTPL